MKNMQNVMNEAIEIIHDVVVNGEDFTDTKMHRLSVLQKTILSNRNSFDAKEVNFVETTCRRLLNNQENKVES